MTRPAGAGWLLGAALLALLAGGWGACAFALLAGGLLGAAGALRARRAAAPRAHCPRGHPVEQYGRFRCAACGAASEGWVWRCGVCGATAGWTGCRCGLAVKNPLLEDRDG